MTRFLAGDVSYNVERRGRAIGGSVLMLLHGFSGSARTWTGLFEAFEERFQIVAVDLLGHGSSDSPPDPRRYRMERCIEDLAAIAAALRVERTILLGYSMGGRVALAFAARYPERVTALILESASPGLASDVERSARIASDDLLARRIERDGIEEFAHWWALQPIFASQSHLADSVKKMLRLQRLDNSAIGLANSLRGLGAGIQSSLWDTLTEISVPALLIAGEADEKFRIIARRMTALMPRASVVEIAGAGHAAHIERPIVFEEAITRFLTEPERPE